MPPPYVRAVHNMGGRICVILACAYSVGFSKEHKTIANLALILYDDFAWARGCASASPIDAACAVGATTDESRSHESSASVHASFQG